jgi:signal transduction histidine kinase
VKSSNFSIRVILLTVISVLNILIAILLGAGVHKSWQSLGDIRSLKHGSDMVNTLYNINKRLSLARAETQSIMYAPPHITESLQESLEKNQTAYNQSLDMILNKIKNVKAISLDIPPIENQHRILRDLNKNLSAALELPPEKRDFQLTDRIFNASTELINLIRTLILHYSHSLEGVDAIVARHIMFKYSVWELTEYAGQEYALIGELIAQEKLPTSQQRDQLISLRERTHYAWEITNRFPLDERLIEKMLPFMEEAESHYFETFDSMKEFFYIAIDPSSSATYPIGIDMWLELSSQAVDSLLALQDTVLQQTQAYINEIEKRAWRQIIISAVIFLFAFLLSLYCWRVIIFRVTRPVNAMVEALYKATKGENYTPPEIVYYDDEIGKLYTVLEAFQENARKIKQSNEELERYAYITAHDLKSPLRAIDNLSQWIQEDMGENLSEQTKEYMATLRQRVRRMEKLLNDILEYSRLGRKADVAYNEVINAQAMIEDAISLANPSEKFSIEIDDAFADINLNRMPLQQIFYNLINNALKHHDKNTGVIKIGVKEDSERYIFSVQDDGPGIAPEYHEKVFEMFQTLKPRDEREGSGMGLAIVKKILTAYGGIINLKSDVGQGTLFCFTWPKTEGG